MLDIRIFAVPGLLLAATALYIVANPSGASVEPLATQVSTPSATPMADPTATPVPVLPAGVSGRLTYRTGLELVTVQLPEAIELERRAHEPSPGEQRAVDWECGGGGCLIRIWREDGSVTIYEFLAIPWAEWSDSGTFAAAVLTLDGSTRVVLVEDDPTPRVLLDTRDFTITTGAWLDGALLLSTQANADGSASLRVLGLDGSLSAIADLASSAAYFYPSPDRSRVLFTQSAPGGWRLWMLDVATRDVSDLGNMGSDPAGRTPPQEFPAEGKGSMYIAWSPDGSKVAFGGGVDPPYLMSTVDLDAGTRVVSEFPNGYPGEIRWSRDGTRIAVSTYDVERTHHETWVIDPLTGAGRHLMDGCVIVWSPDGRFLAVHGEDVPGITIINVETRERGQLTHESSDAPLAWEP